ncbi:MAG TPA: hypothetical protein VMU56_03690 [Beijerinckiaceae bacterium]|nr:hypothetical protein [Beijerinckiaceae bacterium]
MSQSPSGALVKLGASPSFARKMLELGRTAEDVSELMNSAGVPASERPALIKAYSDKNLAVSKETMVRGLTDEAVARDDKGQPKIERLQEGHRHAVFRVECRAAENEKPRILAFKVLEDIDFSTPTTMAYAGLIAGIDECDPQLAMRNLASRHVCDVLGFDVIVKAEIGYFTVEPGGAPTLGIAMEWAGGRPGVETGPTVMNDPAIMRELAKLQLVDQLTGQNDRHKLNYLVDWDTSTVMGIDNDICFGTESRAERLPMAPNTSFPLYIDTDMAAAVEHLTPEALKSALDGKLLDKEIEMTLARLDCLKAAVARRQAEGRVISPNEWGAPKVRADMMARQFDTYWGRDQAGGITIENVRNELTDANIYML